MVYMNNVPQVLKYPRFIDNTKLDHVKNLLCYIIADYGTEGISLLLTRKPDKDELIVLCGDWNGNNIDIQSDDKRIAVINELLAQELPKLANILKMIKVDQAQFFFSIKDGYKLVDMQVSANKLVGPGMIRDLFAKIIPTQEVIKVEPIDDRAYEAIIAGTGSYSGNLVIKPSKFRMIEQNGLYSPLYLRYLR